MKSTTKIISYITMIVFILLWINQFFAIKALYLSEKFQWQRLVDSIVEHSIDFYVRPYDMLCSQNPGSLVSFNPDTYTITVIRDNIQHDFKMDSTETQQNLFLRGMYETRNNELAPLSQLDSLLHIAIKPFTSRIKFVSLKLDSLKHELDRFSQTQTNTSHLIPSPNYTLGFIDGESLLVYYNFPMSIFFEKAWNNIITFCIITLLFIFFMFCVIYLFKFMHKLSKYQETTMHQIVHDWKTPLNSIGMATELLQRKSVAPTDEKGMGKIKLILEETEHLKNSSQQLLRTLSGIIQIQIERSEFDLKKELLSLVEEQRMAHVNKKLLLTLHYLLPDTIIHASRFHLTCAIRNLLDNAIKYGNDTPQISINCYQEHSRLIIEVKDNGPGIAQEKQKYIFNKYYQVDQDEPSKTKKGYGLGLNYVHNVIKAHRGTITLDSTPGKGCTFIIQLKKWKKR